MTTYFIAIVGFLMLYIVVLHIRWKKKMRSYVRKLKEEETQLIHLEKMASLGTLSAGVAHEINNPLTFLVTNLNLMSGYIKEAGVTNEEKMKKIEETLEECVEGVDRIKRIVQDLLSFSHPSRGKRELVDVNELLDVTIRILWNEIKYKVDIVKDYKSSSPVWIDPNQISQVFLNIIMNAVQSIEAKGTVSISTYENDDNIFIEVTDTGCGIPEDKIGEIFTPFYTTKGGPGLGLSVSKSIIENYKGALNVKSKVGEGSTFTIVLPKEKRKDNEGGVE